jgi:hypothetical protein
MPSADFSAAIAAPCGAASRALGAFGSHRPTARRRPLEVSSIAFAARPPNLQSRCLMDMDFAVVGPLVRPKLPHPVLVHQAATVVPRCFQTPPRDGRPCASPALHLHQVVRRTFTSRLSNMLNTPTTRRPSGPEATACKVTHDLDADPMAQRWGIGRLFVLFVPLWSISSSDWTRGNSSAICNAFWRVNVNLGNLRQRASCVISSAWHGRRAQVCIPGSC